MTDKETRVVTPAMAFFKLNADGTCEQATALGCTSYIDERQTPKLFNREYCKHIRENYGPIIGVMHKPKRLNSPPAATLKFILG